VTKLKTLLEDEDMNLRIVAIEGFSKLFFLKIVEDVEVKHDIIVLLCYL
jgi:hypothetical protein